MREDEKAALRKRFHEIRLLSEKAAYKYGFKYVSKDVKEAYINVNKDNIKKILDYINKI